MGFNEWYEATYGSALVSSRTVAEAWAEHRFQQAGKLVGMPEEVKAAWKATACQNGGTAWPVR